MCVATGVISFDDIIISCYTGYCIEQISKNICLKLGISFSNTRSGVDINGYCIDLGATMPSGLLIKCALGFCMRVAGAYATCLRISDYDYENLEFLSESTLNLLETKD